MRRERTGATRPVIVSGLLKAGSARTVKVGGSLAEDPVPDP